MSAEHCVAPSPSTIPISQQSITVAWLGSPSPLSTEHHSSLVHHPHCQQSIVWHHPHQPSPSDPSHCHQLTIPIALSTAGHVRLTNIVNRDSASSQQSMSSPSHIVIPIVNRASVAPISLSAEHVRPISVPVWRFLAEHQSSSAHLIVSRACQTHLSACVAILVVIGSPSSLHCQHQSMSDSSHCHQLTIFIVNRDSASSQQSMSSPSHIVIPIVNRASVAPISLSAEHVTPISVPVWQFLAEHQSSSVHLIVSRACQTHLSACVAILVVIGSPSSLHCQHQSMSDSSHCHQLTIFIVNRDSASSQQSMSSPSHIVIPIVNRPSSLSTEIQ